VRRAIEDFHQTTPPHQGQLIAGDQRSIPPDVPHRLIVDGPVEVAVDFLTRPAMAARRGG